MALNTATNYHHSSCLRGRLAVSSFIYMFICWSSRMTALLLCYHSITPCASKSGISASDICHLWGLFQRKNSSKKPIEMSIDKPKQASSCYCGNLACNSSFCFAASRVQSTNWRQLTARSGLLSIGLLIYFRSLN